MKITEVLFFLKDQNIPFEFHGNSDLEVEGFSALTRYKKDSFTWIKTQKNIPDGFDLSQIKLAFISQEVQVNNVNNIIRTPESKRAFFSTVEHFYGQEVKRPPVGEFTYISSKVKLGKNVRIGHNCTLDGEISIGDNTVIWNHVTIVNKVHIGKNCDIRSGAVIGHDGFAYTEDNEHKKTMVKHFGGVDIGNNVLVGENVCIHRGTIDDTILEDGVKIDALSHIAHNCYFKRNSAAAAPCRTNGSVKIGENAYLAGALVRNQCEIGDNAFIGLGAVVVKNVEENQTVVGNPARPLVKER
ncbi:DapH/DapD/GlmU-related protein [Lawsonibacter sp. LCP25S3_G6]|uniref:DapH/DapD/GlmU-related protein n=1 Tax=unclassified Lawsonibacter TaxID=2617946 RepID=UPI003F979031